MSDFQSTSPEETFKFGETFGGLLEEGDIIVLCGDLGAGKTLLTKGIAKGLGIETYQYVNSPTFTLLHIHEGRLMLAHLDWYRLDEPELLSHLGFEELAPSGHVLVIEWGDKFPDWWRLDPGLTISISFEGGNSRRLHVKAREKRGKELLEKISALNASHS